VAEAMTVCAILARLYEKYGIGVGITNYDDHQHCYLYGRKNGQDKIQINDKAFMSANEAMLKILRMLAEDLKENELII
jgi:hypothetical protein